MKEALEEGLLWCEFKARQMRVKPHHNNLKFLQIDEQHAPTLLDAAILIQVSKRGASTTTIGVTKPHADDSLDFIQFYTHPSKSW